MGPRRSRVLVVLMTLLGGRKAFADQLDSLFSAHPKITGRQQADITGLIGQYVHGNEPSHHMAYLYNYVGPEVIYAHKHVKLLVLL